MASACPLNSRGYPTAELHPAYVLVFGSLPPTLAAGLRGQLRSHLSAPTATHGLRRCAEGSQCPSAGDREGAVPASTATRSALLVGAETTPERVAQSRAKRSLLTTEPSTMLLTSVTLHSNGPHLGKTKN